MTISQIAAIRRLVDFKNRVDLTLAYFGGVAKWTLQAEEWQCLVDTAAMKLADMELRILYLVKFVVRSF